MTPKHLATALALAICATPIASHAGDPPAAVTDYRGRLSYHLLTCKLKVQMADMKAQLKEPLPPEDDPAKCVDGAKRDLKTHYDKANTASKKPGAKAALKEHYVVALSAVDGVLPGIEERKNAYQQRTAAAERRLEEAWNRIAVEF